MCEVWGHEIIPSDPLHQEYLTIEFGNTGGHLVLPGGHVMVPGDHVVVPGGHVMVLVVM